MCPEPGQRFLRSLVLLAGALPGYGWAAETAIVGGMSAGYNYNDNINVTAANQVSLYGMQADGFVELQYNTPQLSTTTHLKLGAERYHNLDFNSDNPQLKKPDASDFDSESYGLTTDISYDWERHTLSLFGSVEQDSNINTQFTDGGLGGLRQLEGATNVDTTVLRPGWRWQLTERQLVDTSLQAQFADYESDRYVNYDYYSAQSTWLYALNERTQLQIRPRVSRYENAAAFSVTSDTYGLEGGIVWSITEKWETNVLGGATEVSTDYGGRGVFVFNPDTGAIEFVQLEDDDNNGFTGSGEIKFTEEVYGFSAAIKADYTPSANGYLQEDNQGRAGFYWTPREQLRFDIKGRVGETNTSSDQFQNKRTYSEAAFRVGYQFAKEWWLSARYRYREQDYDRNSLGDADGYLVSASVSYRLPKEIL